MNDMDGPRRGPSTVSAICINTCTPYRLRNLHIHVYGRVALKNIMVQIAETVRAARPYPVGNIK